MTTKTRQKVGAGTKFTHWDDGRPKVSGQQKDAAKEVFGEELAGMIFDRLPEWAKSAIVKAAPASKPEPKTGQAAFFDGEEVAAKAEPSGAKNFFGDQAAAHGIDNLDRKDAERHYLRQGFAAFFGGGDR